MTAIAKIASCNRGIEKHDSPDRCEHDIAFGEHQAVSGIGRDGDAPHREGIAGVRKYNGCPEQLQRFGCRQREAFRPDDADNYEYR
jgi:hypothetical protein